jgi:glycosyltransferase involved in cell wall biosynthesis
MAVRPTPRTVLVLNHFAAPTSAPGGTRHVELAAHLRGWDAVILAADRNLLDGRRRPSEPPGFRVVRTLPLRGSRLRILSWASYAVTASVAGLRVEHTDVVVGSSPHPLAAAAAAAVARRRKVPFVLEIRDPWPEALASVGGLRPGSSVYRAIAGLMHRLERRADAVVVLAEGVRTRTIERGVAAERVHLVPNGADPFSPPADRDELRRRAGYRPDQLVVIYAGAHGPANGLDLLLDAASALRTTNPEVLVVLAGDGPEKHRLAERVRAEGLTNTRLVPPVPKQQVPDLLAAADVGVHCLAPSDVFPWEVSPNKLFDYLAAALPVLTNTPGEVQATVEDARCGVAAAPTGLADGLRDLASWSASTRRDAGIRGRAWLSAHRSRTAAAAAFEAVLDGLVTGHPAAPTTAGGAG